VSDKSGPDWFHTIEFPDGTVTAGTFDTRPIVDLVPWPQTLKGARCLDIGTCDGFWAFEMERRGASEVVAIDVEAHDPRDESHQSRREPPRTPREGMPSAGQRFEIARAALQSRAQRQVVSVYDLDPAIHGLFDIVFLGTVLIHLRDPAQALEKIARVCTGDLVLVESVDAVLDRSSSAPAARLEPAKAQWWRLNRAGLKAMLNLSGFDVVAESRPFVTPLGASFIEAAARRSFFRGFIYRQMAARPSSLAPLAIFGRARGTYDVAMRARVRSEPRSS
jgi:tRNA (mo5U34)-methyltransferase